MDTAELRICAICGVAIVVGEAWMETSGDGARLRAHAGCLYREEPTHRDEPREAWEPQESTAR